MSTSIASLIPSGTDIVAALGLGDRLVGISHECDHAIAAGKPVLTSSVLDPALTPGAIDAAVSASVAEGTSLYRTDRRLLHDLNPGLVLSQDVCDVCAVNGEVARGDVPDDAELIMLTAVRLAHLWEDLERVAKAAGVEGRGRQVIDETRETLAVTAGTVATRQARRVVALEWGDPLYIAGHWVPELIGLGGGTDVLGEVGMASRRVTLDEVREADPDVIVFLPCGYDLDQAAAEAKALDLTGVRAVDEGQLWAVDATGMFSRCTPQAVVAGTAALASILHPDVAGPPSADAAVRIG